MINKKNKTLENCYDTLSTKGDKFIDRIKDKWINDKIELDKIYARKGQPEVKKRPNIAITENYICSQNMKTVPCNRSYVSTTKLGKKIYITAESSIKHVRWSIFVQ